MCDLIELTKLIEAAFPARDYTTEIHESLMSPTSHPEEEEAKKQFLGNRWDEIPISVLYSECPNPFLIGTVPLQYYLPAFLIGALKEPAAETDFGPSQLMDYLVNFELKPPKKPEKFEKFAARFSSFSREQKDAIAAFLRFSLEKLNQNINAYNINFWASGPTR